MNLSTVDILVFGTYLIGIVFLGIWVSREKKGHQKNSSDYFLAGRSLPWWAIGASLIASNISAEQLIGMSGSGYAIGLAIASYEWMAAITLIIVAKYFLPIFLKKGIYTMPQFLEIRYNRNVRTSLAVFWLLVYVFINLTSVLYLGALALKTIMNIPLIWGVIGLALFSSLYTIYGGLKAVAWTDVVQVTILVLGGLMTSFLALKAIGAGNGVLRGFTTLVKELPDKFDMILKPGQIMINQAGGGVKDAFVDLPGLAVLLGGMWIANLFYWGCNQYITQRALAAKSIKHAQKGLAFAGYLKLLMPLLVVIPGIAAFYLINHPSLIPAGAQQLITKPDNAYPWLLNTFIPAGFKGLAFAALIAAIVSSLSSMVNSTATLFSMDIYKPLINKNATEKQLVTTGRIASFFAILIAIFIAPQLSSLDQAFQYIQEFTGFFSPGIFCIFLYGLFWKKTKSKPALIGAILSLPLSIFFKYATPNLPFMDRMGLVFIICSIFVILFSAPVISTLRTMVIAIIAGSIVKLSSNTLFPDLTLQHQIYIALFSGAIIFYLLFRKSKQVEDSKNCIIIDHNLFATSKLFNFLALGIILILTFLYIIFW
jgi:SSS family solute:Na+ symporter